MFGPPQSLRSDHGKSLLESKKVKLLCNEWGIKRLRLGIPHQPSKNAKVERTNQSVRGLLKALSEQFHAKFHEVIPLANFLFNATPHTIEGISPYEIYMGRKIKIDLPTIPSNATPTTLEYLAKVRQHRSKIYKKVIGTGIKIRQIYLKDMNSHRKQLKFADGDAVLLLDLRTPKQGETPKKDRLTYYRHPFLIRRRLRNLLILENLITKQIIHASINHVKRLVPRNKLFSDLPDNFKRIFGHPFRPFQILQDSLPTDIKDDFIMPVKLNTPIASRTRNRQNTTRTPDPDQVSNHDSDIDSDAETDSDSESETETPHPGSSSAPSATAQRGPSTPKPARMLTRTTGARQSIFDKLKDRTKRMFQ